MGDEVEGIVCTVCSKAFSTVKELCDHSEEHDVNLCDTQLGCTPDKFNVTNGYPVCSQYHNIGKGYAKNNNVLNAGVRRRVKAKESVKEGIENLECRSCGKVYTDKMYVLMHEKAHDTGFFECHICKKKFLAETDVLSHYTIHLHKKPYICEICGLRCKLMRNLKAHYTNHAYRKVCKFCRKAFDSAEKLKEHGVFDSCTNLACSCHGCGRTFWHYSGLTLHLRSCPCAHCFTCEICRTDFESPEKLKLHMRVHGNDDVNPAFLPDNNVERRTYSRKRANLNSVHKPLFSTSSSENASFPAISSENALLLTTSENTLFPTTSSEHAILPTASYENAILPTISSENKLCICKTCGACFESAEILEFHANDHVNDQQLILSVIKKEYDSEIATVIKKEEHDSEIATVIKKEYDSEIAMPEIVLESPLEVLNENNHFPCKVCGIDYPSKTLLESHMPTHIDVDEELCVHPSKTGVVQNTYSRKSEEDPQAVETVESIFASKYVKGYKGYACSICGVVFKNTTHLKAHLLLHEDYDELSRKLPRTVMNAFGKKKDGVKTTQFSESYSSPTVQNSDKIDMHPLASTSDKSFPCNICGVCFLSPVFLDSHLLLHVDRFQQS